MAGVVENWKLLGVGLRASLIVGVIVILTLTVGAFWWLASEEYNVLFADLEPRDAASVVAALEEMKVDYRLAEGGTQIQVPESLVHKVRLKLMGSDVPLIGGAGFEIFNDSDFGMTEFSQRINYQRALEGELTRTVVSLKEVKYARVHLVMPERGLFKQDDNPPSASVTLFLHAGHQAAPKQILGIQRLVAAAVPGLTAAQVTVTDQNGLTLSQHLPAQEGVAAVSERLRQKQSVEAYLVAKAKQVLERHFGAHQAVVSIDVDLEFNQVKRTLENVLPRANQNDSGVVRRRETRLGSGGSSKEKHGDITTEVEYRLGRAVEQIIEHPGKILRLSVGVMVPPSTSEKERENIRELVKMAVGYDQARGDAIVIYAMDIPAKGFAAAHVGPEQEKIEPDRPPWPKDAQLSNNNADSLLSTDTNDFFRRFQKWLTVQMDQFALEISVVSALVLLGAVIICLGLRRRIRNRTSLQISEEDRRRILEDIQRWLDGEDANRESEAA